MLSNISPGAHCSVCLNFNGCCFPKNNMPKFPLHFKCHCRIETVYGLVHRAKGEISKFTDYIFDLDKNKGKKALFEGWGGYGIIDSELLLRELIKQGQQKCASGDFTLGNLDQYGQRISIRILLKKKRSSETVTFISGWMVYPDGENILITPIGGK